MENLRIDNQVKQYFINLRNEGFYFQPQKFDNCIVVQLTKDLNPVGKECTAERKVIFEMNLTTAKQAAKIFGFKIRKEQEYFGKADPVASGMKRSFY